MELPGRASGILLHPTSLPGSYWVGDLGRDAYRFVDFLHASGQKMWQVLPLGPTGFGDSPYSGLSAFAGNPLLISPEKLYRDGLLSREDIVPPVKDQEDSQDQTRQEQVDYAAAIRFNEKFLRTAFSRFRTANLHNHPDYEQFCTEQAFWLDTFSLFMALKRVHGYQEWTRWASAYVHPSEAELKKLHQDFASEMDYYKFVEFEFFKQWRELKDYANQREIRIIGDIPIYVAFDSADTWGRRDLFQLDAGGYPVEVGGVPPDYFSQDGQLWGNPVYDWEALKKTNYHWWVQRFQHALSLVDIVRIDHFRGFEAYWAVPYGEQTAVRGQWKKAPGAGLFTAVEKALGPLPVIAEDLGVITPEVIQLRDRFHFPGIKLLQFAFDSNEQNDFLPFRYNKNCVVYTGTHDNDTTLGWFTESNPRDRELAMEYMNSDGQDICWDFIRLGMSSVANMAVFPMQDVLSLGSEARMNFPGTVHGNWAWRFRWDMVTEEIAEKLERMTRLYGRRAESRRRFHGSP